MRGKLNEGEEKPDAELREKLHAMESKVRKMRETRNNFNAQAKVSAEKRNSVQSQYKEHREKIELFVAEVRAMRAEIKSFKEKRNAIQSQMRDLISQIKGKRKDHTQKRSATAEYADLKQQVDSLEKKFETTSVGVNKEKEMVKKIKEFSKRIEELEPEVTKFKMVEVDMSDIDSAIKTLKAEADAAHNSMIEAVERLNAKTPEVDEAFAHRDFLKSEGDRFHTEFVELKEKANEVHAKIEELMVDVNKARDELKSVREERKSWLTDHNASVKNEMKTGAQSEEVAELLTNSLLSNGSITFGGLSNEDFVSKSKSKKSDKKKNMRRVDVSRRR
ncbi:MAG: coiled-coil protein [Candidatus Poseidoniaceae archaeon]